MTAQPADRPEFVFSKTTWKSVGGLDSIFAFAVLCAMVRLVAALRTLFPPKRWRLS